MKRFQPTTTLLLAFVLAACGEHAAPDGPSPASAPAGQPAETSVTKARREFQEAVSHRIDAVGARIEELRAKASAADAETRPKLEKLADDLAAKREQAAKHLHELGDQVADKWDEFKQRLELLLDDLEKSVREALG